MFQEKKNETPGWQAAPSQASAKNAPPPQPSQRLYSMAGLLTARKFEGRFNARGQNYEFSYAPSSAAIAGGKLELTGSLAVRGPGGASRTAERVRATLVATQGAVGGAPERRQIVTGGTGAANLATSDQQQEQAKTPELGPGSDNTLSTSAGAMPVTESTGPLSHVGVLYLRLSKLDGAALGVPVDLGAVQLNARLAPESDPDRDLLWLYTDLVAAVYGAQRDSRAANERLVVLNRALKG
jgi:hypothetical protein